MRRRTALMIAMLLIFLCLSGCGTKKEENYFTSPEQLNDSRYTIGVGMGTADIHAVGENLPKAEMIEYSSVENGYLAVQAGMLDAFAYSRDSMQYAMESGSMKGVKLLAENVGEGTDVVVGISPKTTVPNLKQKTNAFINAIHSDGTFDEMYTRWVLDAQEDMPEIPKPEHPVCKITIGTSGTAVPFSYYKGTELTGMDLELIARFANYLNAEVEIVVLDYTGLSAASESGTVDCVFANLHATPERAESMDFSVPIYTLQTGLMVRDGSIGGEHSAAVRPRYASISELQGSDVKIGIEVGTCFEELTMETFPNAQLFYYDLLSDLPLSVSTGELDAFVCDEPIVRLMVKQKQGITYLSESLGNNDYAFAFPKTEEGEALCAQVSEFIRELKSDGTLKEIETAWLDNDVSRQHIDCSDLTGANGTVRMAMQAATEPFCFVRDGQTVGFDMDILTRFCRKYGYGLETYEMNLSAIIPSLGTVCDIGTGGLCPTPERMEKVYFSEPYYEAGGVIVVGTESGVSAEKDSFWQSVQDSFEKTFIREQRWKLIVQGIGTTVFISAFSALFGTILGFGICMLRRVKNPLTHALTTVYIRILQGTPQVVLLMVLFYLVFSGTGLSGKWVAIIAFSMNFAAYVSEMMRTGIEAVDIGQTEAALALGFTKSRAFFKFILPQAAQNFLPVYKGEFISLVKMTSVVGYIAVQDLTKMSDIIRSRTYEAFFPLITTALIYFVISGLLTLLLRYVEVRVEPDRSTNRENRIVKGVTMQ